MDQQPKPLFVYGTLCAAPLLAWALTGDCANVDTAEKLAHPATVRGYGRFSLHHCDFPGAVKLDGASSIEGLLLRLQDKVQRRKLDDFEGESYKVTPVEVVLQSGERVQADMYVWDGDAAVTDDEWKLDTFIKERLEDWLDIFSGMELIGDTEN